MNETVKNFLNVFKCPVCLEPIKLGEEEGTLCGLCRAKLESEKREICVDCGLPAPLCRCPGELMGVHTSRRLVKLTFYVAGSGSASDCLVVYMKHNLDHRAFDFTAGQLAPAILSELCSRGVSPDRCLVTYAPRSARAERRDGFDQGRELARAVSAFTGIKFEDIIRRKRVGRMQKTLDHASRSKNAKRNFFVEDGTDLAGYGVVLVDDVVTTGSTMNACAELLRHAGASTVLCVAVAQTSSRFRLIDGGS